MYYARLIHYKLGTNQRQAAEELTKKFDKISRNLYGFRGNVYFFDDPNGEYKALNYWDTKELAEKAHEVLFPQLENELKNLTTEKPRYRIFEVFDPTDDQDMVASHTIK
ncbi:hypothetical protein KDJ21_024635 [Metabacillus litoralis]|uniref:hypothetical protein n=1 Tax=Metabacillus TaxID=2675233 RepID=UPI000EF60562|nr:hypothetical protein [Metabacillus litoralis]MCM3164147.1 hypothetical protein [Metabacillus litoralis]MCM3408448.1 hypothetical protein [Metabacillus litoralis]UHA59884.1 hypothetical protein KDJ21_024635 [Metabacillus litoralis]